MDVNALISKFKKKQETSLKDKKTTPLHGSLEFYHRQLDSETIPWYTKKPYHERNDPLYRIPARVRWQLVKDYYETPLPSQTPVANTEWEDRYVANWYQSLEKKYPDMAKLQFLAVNLFSDRVIALKKNVSLAGAPRFKRGTRGATLQKEALAAFPPGIISAMDAAISNGGVLCHVQGVIVTLTPEVFRYV
ncbi:MAG: hypothetical protein Q8P05_05425 [Candidatus Diapherotrites archaeon]|nr:hypothetical protein [Candidatus Diapherotrites archaeon]